MINNIEKSTKKSCENEALIPIMLKCRLSGEKYEMYKSESIAEGIKGGYVYSLEIPYNLKGNANIRILVSFFDGKGKELIKGYTENGLEFTAPENAVTLKTQLVVFGKNAAEFEAKEEYVRRLRPYSERNVILAAAAVKYDKPKRTFEKNMEDTLFAVDAAAKKKPDIILASECFYGRNINNLSSREKAITMDGYPIEVFRRRAEKYKSYICFSAHTILDNGNFANLAIIIGRNGEIVGTYKKTHLTMGEILAGIEPGDEPGVFDLDFGRVGVAICWDIFYPEYVRLLHLAGVDVILNPTAGFTAERASRRAKESGAYIVTSGSHKASESRIISPDGKFLDIGDYKKNYAAAKVDLNRGYYTKWLSSLSYSQSGNVYKYERRPDMYK